MPEPIVATSRRGVPMGSLFVASAGARIAAIGLNAQGLIRYVRAPGGQMPAYTDKVITDQELTDIHAYLQTMAKAKQPKDIPLLNALEKK